MLKLRNPVKHLKDCFARRKKKTTPEEFKRIGEIAWKSVNLENEPKLEAGTTRQQYKVSASGEVA